MQDKAVHDGRDGRLDHAPTARRWRSGRMGDTGAPQPLLPQHLISHRGAEVRVLSVMSLQSLEMSASDWDQLINCVNLVITQNNLIVKKN